LNLKIIFKDETIKCNSRSSAKSKTVHCAEISQIRQVDGLNGNCQNVNDNNEVDNKKILADSW